jgi:hypothetical protein
MALFYLRMRARTWIIVIVAALILLRAAGIASGAWNAHKVGAAQARSGIIVRVRPRPKVHHNVQISFRPSPLSYGHYFYAVIVLKPYKHYTRESPPPCSTSSDMLHTEYGYAHRPHVRLTLTPAASENGHWCPGGLYEGGVYSVPELPPCEGIKPCPSTSESYDESICSEPTTHCDYIRVRPFRPFEYPDGRSSLPRPVGGTVMIAHFRVKF